jgi:hypothetical protein
VPGWRAARLKDRPFPGLVLADQLATGWLLTDLNDQEHDLIREFEGPFYALRTGCLEDGEFVSMYVCVDLSLVLTQNWDRDTFLRHDLDDYVARCAVWLARQRGPRHSPAPSEESSEPSQHG